MNKKHKLFVEDYLCHSKVVKMTGFGNDLLTSSHTGTNLDVSFLFDCEGLINHIRHNGILIINNIPIVDKKDDILITIASLIGKPFQDENQGPLIMDIRPNRKRIENINNHPAYETCSYFPLHTDLSYVDDPPDICCLYFINHDINKEARSFFCNINDVIKEIDGDIISELLKDEYEFNPPLHYKIKTPIRKSILSKVNDGYEIRFREDVIYACGKAHEALNILSKKMDAKKIEFLPEESSVIFINNKTTTHGRTSFVPTYSENFRLIKRIFINFR